MKTRRLAVLLTFALACSDESEHPTCADADYSACGSPLPARQYDGQPWPMFTEALAQACMDGSSQVSGWQSVRGMCADGKQFISKNGGFAGDTRYFRGESLVGVAGYGDVGSGPCECPFQRFQGTLETVRCDAPIFEALCESSLPMAFDASFSQGTAFCLCDDPSYQ